MIPQFLLGLAGGVAAGKFVSRRLRGGGCGGGFRGGFGRFGGFGHGGPRRFIHLMRELDLDAGQRDQVHALFGELRHAMREMRGGRFDKMEAAARAVAGETFDREKVEQLAAEQAESHAKARAKVVEALERLHAILTPAQRAVLRDFLDAGGERHDDGGDVRL